MLTWFAKLLIVSMTLLLSSIAVAGEAAGNKEQDAMKYPYIYHLIQADLWHKAKTTGDVYYPPTYEQDGFTHATANSEKLLSVANHFYTNIPGAWYCLEMTIESLEATGVKTIFEGTAPVGDIQPEFEGSKDELFPHILGGIAPDAVLKVHTVKRAEDGTFLSIDSLTAN